MKKKKGKIAAPHKKGKKKVPLKREGVEPITPDDIETLTAEVRELRASLAAQPPPPLPPPRTRVALCIESPLIEVDVRVSLPPRLVRVLLGSLMVTLSTAMVAMWRG